MKRLNMAISCVLAMGIVAAQAAKAADALEEVIVTAQRTAQNLQDVPLSVTAFSGNTLQSIGVDRLIDVTGQVPNLGVFTIFGDAQQPSFHIRGIGLISFTDSFEPPVAMYVDDVYIGTGVGQSSQVFDVERLEVLRGPQGTLFGRNTTGGLFHVITRRPTSEPDLRATLRYGSDNDILVDAAGGGPVSDSVRLRLAGRYVYRDGWSKGFFDGDQYDNADSYALRGQVAVDFSDNVEGLLIAHYSNLDQRTPGYGITGYLDPTTGEECSIDRIHSGNCVSPSLGGASGNDLGGFRPGRTPGQSTASFGVEPRQSLETWGLNGQIVARLGGDLTLTSITAVENVDKYYFEDLVAFSDGFLLDAQQFTQELRLNGTWGKTEWIVGAFYFDDTKDMGSFDPTPVFGFTTDGEQDTTSWALFAQGHIPITDRMKLTAGVRYTDERKEIHYTTDFGIDERRKLSTDAVTGRLGIDYDVSDDVMLFASVASGFKSGGFNGQFVFAPDALDPVDNEYLVSYEAGVKSELFGRRARLNATAFYYDYRDMQLSVFVPTPSGGVGTRLRNAGDVRIYGGEADFDLQATDRFSLTLGVGLIDSEFLDEATIRSAGVEFQIKGHELPLTPQVSLNGTARYQIPTSSGRFYVQGEASWRDDQFFTVDNSPREGISAYALVNLRAGWAMTNDHLSVEAFVENVTDKTYWVFSADQTPDFGAYTWGRPRWGGISLNFRY